MKLQRIDYNEGYLWVDKESSIIGCLTTDGVELYYPSKDRDTTISKAENHLKTKVAKIVAQSPNLSIPNVPYVEFGEDVIDPIWIALKTLLNDCVSSDGSVQIPSNKVVKLASDVFYKYQEQNSNYHKLQSKGRYSEGQLDVALFRLYKRISLGERKGFRELSKEVIESLNQPPLEIDIETILDIDCKNYGQLNIEKCKNLSCDCKKTIKPITYERDGKTYLKVKL